MRFHYHIVGLQCEWGPPKNRLPMKITLFGILLILEMYFEGFTSRGSPSAENTRRICLVKGHGYIYVTFIASQRVPVSGVQGKLPLTVL